MGLESLILALVFISIPTLCVCEKCRLWQDWADVLACLSSPRAHNRFNQVVEAKRFECVFLCRKVC